MKVIKMSNLKFDKYKNEILNSHEKVEWEELANIRKATISTESKQTTFVAYPSKL